MPAKRRVGWHHRVLGIPRLWDAGLEGLGVRVAVLDTGVAAPDGLDRNTYEYLDSSGRPIGPLDLDGHGTAVASVIAGGMNGALGIAPRAAISSYRMMDPGDALAKAEDAFAAIVTRDDIDVVVCAFVLSRVTPAIEAAVRALAMRGVVVIAPAGNDETAVSPFPEQTPHAITIAALDADLAPRPGGRLGLWIDAAAPGDDILALNPDGDPISFGDTSAAAAIVGGVAAILLSSTASRARRRKRGMMFESFARASAKKLADAPPDSVGAGLINPAGMLALLNNGVP